MHNVNVEALQQTIKELLDQVVFHMQHLRLDAHRRAAS
jgi:hypothetical protein